MTSEANDRYVKVGVRATLARVNRRLGHDGERIQRARSTRTTLDLGAFFRVNVNAGIVVDRNVDLEALARDLGALQSFERLDEAGV